jgi:hypothetical protein
MPGVQATSKHRRASTRQPGCVMSASQSTVTKGFERREDSS